MNPVVVASGMTRRLRLMSCSTPIVRPSGVAMGTARIERVRYPIRSSKSASKRYGAPAGISRASATWTISPVRATKPAIEGCFSGRTASRNSKRTESFCARTNRSESGASGGVTR